MMMCMRMELSPQIFMGLTCPECGLLYSKPTTAATDHEIIEVGIHCGAIDVDTITHTQACKKCGRTTLTDIPPAWYVSTPGYWFVVRCKDKRTARKIGVEEFGRGIIEEVRRATDEEVHDYRRQHGAPEDTAN